MTITNYGGNLRFEPRRVAYPRSVEELRAVVRLSGRLRVMGARHSWSDAIVTDDMLVSLDRMSRVLRVDSEAGLVTVEAGIRLKDLIRALEAEGLALANLGSIAEQSVAGAISTGTHGTGITFRCLADQVERLALIDAAGEERRLDRDHPDFDAVVVGLGAFGVVHEMTLRVVPSFQLHAITDTQPFDEVIERLDEYVHGHDHFKLWWLVPSDEVIVFSQRRTDAVRDDSDLQRWLKDELLAVGVYRTALALQHVLDAGRPRLVPFTNRVLGREVGRRFERTCKSHVGFLTPAPPVHRESEWAFDFRDARALLRAYRALLLESGHAFSFIQEIRFSRGDDLWLSPAYQRDSIWLSLYNIDRPARWGDQRRRFEDFARAHHGRPHWGKEAGFEHDYLAARWPKLGDFAALSRAYDPAGKMRNRWLDEILGEPAERAPG